MPSAEPAAVAVPRHQPGSRSGCRSPEAAREGVSITLRRVEC